MIAIRVEWLPRLDQIREHDLAGERARSERDNLMQGLMLTGQDFDCQGRPDLAQRHGHG